jgi:Ca-activated chloride channel homolog
MTKTNTILLILFILITSLSYSQTKTEPITRILFVFDASMSMHSSLGNETRMTVAKRTLIGMIDSLENIPNIQLALRMYGHQSVVPPQDCNDTRLEVPFSPNSAGMIRQKLRWVEPKGTTPIARSLELAARDFPVMENARNIIILITDGIESCDGDPCAVSRALQERGVTLKPFIIGLGLEVDVIEAFKCVGRVFNAQTEKQFKEVLQVAVSSAINSTTAQVNLLDKNGKATETDVVMTFYDNVSKQVKANIMHTINQRGVPDTVMLDPVITYDMVVHTLPPVSLRNLELVPGKHSIFAVDAPQGYLILKKPTGSFHKDLQFRVIKASNKSTVNLQTVDRTEKYICGKYDVEIFTLPRIYLKNVEIKQSETTTLRIQQPGQLSILKTIAGYGAILEITKDGLEHVVNLDFTSKTTETYILQPGKYKLVYRTTISKESIYTIENEFEIKSGRAEYIRLN